MRQAASALQYAHDRQIVHQDVKPSNFLIRNNPEDPQRPDVLLADFGVARFSTTTSSMSHSIRGTPTYMAPEQWNAEPVPATDQYALAVMAYELLTGRPPFQGPPMRMMYQHNNVQPEPPSARNPRLPNELDEVILRALAKKPGERFASITAFAKAFQQASQSDDTPTFVKPLQGGGLEPIISPSKAENIDRTTPVLEQKMLADTTNTTLGPDTREIQAPTRHGSTLKGKALLAALALLIIIASVGFFYFAGKNQAITKNGNTVTTTSQVNNAATTQSQDATNAAGTATAQAINANATNTSLASANATATAVADKNGTATAVADRNATATAIADANATATAIAQANATATAVAANANPYPPYTGTLVLSDPLVSNDTNSWDTNAGCFFGGGSYHVSKTGNFTASICMGEATNFSNFVFQAQMTFVKGDSGGLVFRYSNGSSFYWFSLHYTGFYELYDPQSGGTLTSGQISINISQPQLIAVVAQGSRLDIYVNKQYVATVNNSQFSSGKIGFFCEALSGPTEMAFSNVKVWAL